MTTNLVHADVYRMVDRLDRDQVSACVPSHSSWCALALAAEAIPDGGR